MNPNNQRNKVITELQPLVYSIANKVHRKLPKHIDRDILVSEGNLAILEAYDRFDPERGVKFSTFATTRIHGAILDYLRHIDSGTRTLRKIEQELNETQTRLSNELNREVTWQEAAVENGMSVKEYSAYQVNYHKAVTSSLEYKQSNHDSEMNEIKDTIIDQSIVIEEGLLNEAQREMIKEMLGVLNLNEQQMITSYYFDDLNLKEIGAMLGVSESRVSQIHKAALDKMLRAYRKI